MSGPRIPLGGDKRPKVYVSPREPDRPLAVSAKYLSSQLRRQGLDPKPAWREGSGFFVTDAAIDPEEEKDSPKDGRAAVYVDIVDKVERDLLADRLAHAIRGLGYDLEEVATPGERWFKVRQKRA